MARPGLPSSPPNWGLWVPKALKGQIIIRRESEAWAPQRAAKINRGGGVLNNLLLLYFCFGQAVQRQEREGTGKAEGNIKLDLRGSGIGGRLRRRRAGGVEHLSPVAVHVQLPRETMCPFLLRLPEEGQGRPEGDGLLLGAAGNAAVQWFQEGEPEPLSLQSCSEKVMAEANLPVLGPHLRSSGGLIAALQGSSIVPLCIQSLCGQVYLLSQG